MIAKLDDWIGHTETQTEFADGSRMEKLSALLDGQTDHWQHNQLPELAHWFYCQPIAKHADIDKDGHIKRGGFIPPISLPRRMWASSDILFHAPLKLDQKLTRKSKILALSPKKNKKNEDLIFLTIHHQISDEAQGLTEETQHIVYKSDAKTEPRQGRIATQKPEVSRSVAFDSIHLFRFSALTFNAHRIHWDRDYAKTEGYSGLVVHAPYLAFLLLHHFLAHRNQPVRRFSFRAERPLFDNSPKAKLCFAQHNLWVEAEQREILMSAKLQ